MNDASEGKIIGEFVRLTSKMYSMKIIDGKESNTAKGVNNVTEFDEFKDTLFDKKIIRHKMKRIQSKKHKIGTYKINKISLSGFYHYQHFHIDLKNRFSQATTNKTSFKKILTKKRDSHR